MHDLGAYSGQTCTHTYTDRQIHPNNFANCPNVCYIKYHLLCVKVYKDPNISQRTCIVLTPKQLQERGFEASHCLPEGFCIPGVFLDLVIEYKSHDSTKVEPIIIKETK